MFLLKPLDPLQKPCLHHDLLQNRLILKIEQDITAPLFVIIAFFCLTLQIKMNMS